jgi:hypothetical protein
MDIFAFDLLSLFTWQNITAILMGVLIGISIGMMPGLGPTVGVALVLPVTYTMSTVPAILLLVALYQAAEYGGSISAITLGIPGTASAVATTLDGNPMSKKGYPGKALGYSLYASFCGGLFGGVLLLDLVKNGEGYAHLKLTAPYRITLDPDYSDVIPLARAAFEAAPTRMVWGSDYPHASFGHHDTVKIFNLLLRIFPDERDRKTVLADNPAELYGFGK